MWAHISGHHTLPDKIKMAPDIYNTSKTYISPLVNRCGVWHVICVWHVHR